MGAEDKPLEELVEGDAVRYDMKEWIVKDRSFYRESENYEEIQWTLFNKSEGDRYLLRSSENKDGKFEIIWVFTKPVDLADIGYRDRPGGWEKLKETEFVPAPPKELKLTDTVFAFEGETVGKAKDDEGLMVTKLTWDYYDSSRAHNLALEVWKEEDRDYPEAYLGLVIEPYKVSILPPEAAGRIRRAGVKINSSVIGYGCLPLIFLLLFGVPFDVITAFCIPAAAVAALFTVYSMPWLRLASFCVWVIMAAFFVFTKFGAAYWVITLSGVIAASLAARLCNSLVSKDEKPDYSSIAITGLLPALWIYSFIMYFRFAPGPHTGSQFLITCFLPVAASGICYIVNRFMENMYVR